MEQPPWDNSISDMTKYSLNPEEVLCRKLQRISLNKEPAFRYPFSRQYPYNLSSKKYVSGPKSTPSKYNSPQRSQKNIQIRDLEDEVTDFHQQFNRSPHYTNYSNRPQTASPLSTSKPSSRYSFNSKDTFGLYPTHSTHNIQPKEFIKTDLTSSMKKVGLNDEEEMYNKKRYSYNANQIEEMWKYIHKLENDINLLHQSLQERIISENQIKKSLEDILKKNLTINDDYHQQVLSSLSILFSQQQEMDKKLNNFSTLTQ